MTTPTDTEAEKLVAECEEASPQDAAHDLIERFRSGDCPFCGRDPYHYVDNGVGMERVAVVCCDLGIALFQDGDEQLSRAEGERHQAAHVLSGLLALIESQRAELAETRANLNASRKLVELRTRERDSHAERADGNYDEYRAAEARVTALTTAAQCALGHLTGNMDGDMDLGDPVELLRQALSRSSTEVTDDL